MGDFHHSFLASLASLELLFRNQDVMHKEVSLCIEEGKVFLNLQDTHSLIVLTLQNLCHDGLFDMILTACHIGHLYTVAIKGKHRVALCYKDGFAAIIRLERVLAVGLADKSALLHLRLQVQFISTVTYFRQPVVPCHFFHHVDGKHLHRVCIEF